MKIVGKLPRAMKAIVEIGKIGLALIGAMLILGIVAPIVFGISPFAETDRSFCVVVEDAGDFTGKYLKHRQAISAEIVKTTDFEAKGGQIDVSAVNRTVRFGSK